MAQTQIYPAWQETIRKGQAYIAEREAQYQAAADEAWQLETLEEGKQLGRVLSLFGINAEPTSNDYQIDDFRFSFGLHPGTKLGDHGRMAFYLSVTYAKDGYEDDDPWALSKTIMVNNAVDDDWSQAHAQLANVLDEITRKAPGALARIAVSKGWFTVIVKHADEPETDSEESCEGIPAGYGYLSPLLESPDFVRVEFVIGLIRTTIFKME